MSIDAKKELAATKDLEFANITIEAAATKIAELRDAILFGDDQNDMDTTPFSAAILLQALGVMTQASALLKQADMMRARELAGNF